MNMSPEASDILAKYIEKVQLKNTCNCDVCQEVRQFFDELIAEIKEQGSKEQLFEVGFDNVVPLSESVVFMMIMGIGINATRACADSLDKMGHTDEARALGKVATMISQSVDETIDQIPEEFQDEFFSRYFALSILVSKALDAVG